MGWEVWGEGENTVSASGLQNILIILCSSEVRGVTGPCQDNRGNWEHFLIVLSPKALCWGAHCAQIHLSDCPGAVAEEFAEELDWVSLSSGTEKVPPIHCRFSWHIPSYILTSTVVKRDLSPSSWRPAPDLSQSHHQGTLAHLLLVMTPHILQLHSLRPAPHFPQKTQTPLMSFVVFTLWMLPFQWKAQHADKICQA